MPTPATRAWMIKQLNAGYNGPARELVTRYFRTLTDPTPLAPFEQIEDLKFDFVPNSRQELKDLVEKIAEFERGGRAVHAFRPHGSGVPTVAPPKAEPEPAPKPAAEPETAPADPLWWRKIIVSVPRKGMKRAEYMKNPDTIGALYDKRHGNDEEAETARRRLFGLQDWMPEPREFKGKMYQPSEADHLTHKALQAFYQYFAREHPGEKL